MNDPLTKLMADVESSLRAKQLKLDAPIDALERALVDYKRAVHEQLANEFAREHRFSQPGAAKLSPVEAAQRLLLAVQALPELSSAAPKQSPERAPARSTKPALEKTTETASARSTQPAPAVPAALSRLAEAASRGPIVIVGGLMRQDRLQRIPPALVSKVEWIDTNRGGSHAIGNLAQRIRQNRVAALIIIDGQVSHKQTDPVLAAAREVNVPAAYAGKGGQNALLRALSELEKMLSRSAAD